MKEMFIGAAFAILIVSATVFLVLFTPENTERRKARHACENLARQVAAGDLPLDRFMATRCSAKYLPDAVLTP
ncbi:MAG: hypothetical protein Q4G24_04650 [Paracoccus sp. (in: a-proteobacteria)]|uniref:hypothetical protein n=1 Tax=Paracoccus sp. TaxID=267 RepID=UPI0026E0D3BC|nr:hypothetical protein [Paracoccus sp. (in: a-proteobacteria)]MDO5620742.1 hypothetical protein [Paracoccus sp. (in: a-proteobacteria)]